MFFFGDFMKSKVKLFMLLSLFFLIYGITPLSAMIKPYFQWSLCPEGSRVTTRWRVLTDDDGDGIWDHETVQNCNGHVDKHTWPAGLESVSIGTTPAFSSPADPTFDIFEEGDWVVAQKDSESGEEIYRVSHWHTPNTTFITISEGPVSPPTDVYYEGAYYSNFLEQVKMYPIPANNIINFTFPSIVDYDLEIQLFDTRGKILYKNSMLVNKTNTKLEIDVANYQPGIYFVKFDAIGLSFTKKIMIIR
jgi:Secretion system C-terminal sorting domain